MNAGEGKFLFSEISEMSELGNGDGNPLAMLQVNTPRNQHMQRPEVRSVLDPAAREKVGK